MTEFVNIPVPVDRAQEVYELLAKKKGGSNDSAQTSAVVGLGPGDEGFDPFAGGFDPLADEFDPYVSRSPWTDELLDRMAVDSSPNMRNILGVIADHSPSWVTTGQIADEIDGLTARQVASAFGPFQRRVTNRYKMKALPFEARFFSDEGLYRYSMPGEIAPRMVARLRAIKESEADRK